MAPSSFRRTAVVCGIVTASLGLGLLTPATASAVPTSATAVTSAEHSTSSNPDFEAIPVDPAIGAPRFVLDWSTPYGSRTVTGVADGDEAWLVIGDTVYDRAKGPGFLFNVQDRHRGEQLEVITTRTAEDGSQTRSERTPMPLATEVSGVDAPQNTFTPGTNQFSGSATPGATVVATDTLTDTELFTADVSDARADAGTWSAEAELAAATSYSITFTQTTKDGLKHELRGVTYSPEGRPPSDNPDFDAIPVDPSLSAPEFLQDWITPWNSRTVIGTAEGDSVWLVIGNQVFDHSGGTFALNVQDRHADEPLEVIRVHEAADGSLTQAERVAIPRAVQVTGAKEHNVFTPGPHEFTGTATAGATLVATDTRSGETLFTTEVTDARNGVGSWTATADLAAGTDYTVTFTQTTKNGLQNEMRSIGFSPEESDGPAAPEVGVSERRLDGSFVLGGQAAEGVAEIVVQDESGEQITSAELTDAGWSAQVPQDRLGSTVFVVAEDADGTASPHTAVELTQLPTDSGVAQPTLRNVYVHPNGDVQVIGERDDAAGLWIMQGERVIVGVPHREGWSFTIPATETGEQIDIANLGYDQERGLSSLSERVPLPRLLEVDGIAQENTYTPGAREFSGTAESGATITATDNRGNELFSTEAAGARSGTGTWKADADLTGTDGYEVTFTQKTSDGRTSVMRDITFTPQFQPFGVTSPEAGSDHKGKTVTFTGTGTPGEIVTLHVTNFASTDVTAEVGDDGTWKASRYIGTGAYTFDITQRNTAGATTGEVKDFQLNNAPTSKPFAVTSPEAGSDHKGKTVTFTGTGTPNDTVTLHVTNFPSADVEVPVGTDGTWKASRFIGTGAYTFDITQRNTAGATTGEVKDFRLNQSAAGNDRPFAVTSPTAGSTFTPDTVMRFTGTGPVGAHVFVDPGAGLASVETVVGTNGEWTVGKYVGNGNYRFVVTMTPTAGDPVVSDPINVTPTR